MSTKFHNFAVWCGPLFALLFFIALTMIGFFPPPDATLTGEQYLEIIDGSINIARLGCVLGYIAAMFSMPWNAIIAVHVWRAEGRTPLSAITCISGGLINTVAFIMMYTLFSPAVFRPERAPELIQLMVDTAWLLAVMWWIGFAVQCLSVTVGGLSDKRADPIFPRWICFLMVWMAVGGVMGSLGIFFFEGPFSWNGLVAFWIPVSVFIIYMIGLVPVLLRANKQLAAEDLAEP